jgi:hydroxymethylpyrimidine/phosphomethylpyrimidine kinase
VILSIAGYDPSSGAGITADIKTAAAHGCFAVTCITALTVQSTQGVSGVQPVDAKLVAQTLAALSDDFQIAAVRLGMLGAGEVAAAVADFLQEKRLPNVVLDPVIRSSSGASLLDDEGLTVLRSRLLALSDVVTPNLAEAAILTGGEPLADETPWDQAYPVVRNMAARLRGMGAKAVIVTGGHLEPPNDYLSFGSPQLSEEVIGGERIVSRATHGTGCAFATALACQLALGSDLPESVRAAKAYVRRTILAAYPLGKGRGPMNHFPDGIRREP